MARLFNLHHYKDLTSSFTKQHIYILGATRHIFHYICCMKNIAVCAFNSSTLITEKNKAHFKLCMFIQKLLTAPLL